MPQMSTTFRKGQQELVEELRIKMASTQPSRSRSTQSRTPKRHSIRIEKPRTPKASPRAFAERRKTFTGNSNKPYSSLAEQYRIMYGAGRSNDEAAQFTHHNQTSRPLSWHPTTTPGLYGLTSSPAPEQGYIYPGPVYAHDQVVYSPYDQYLPYPSELTQSSRQDWYSDVNSYSAAASNTAAWTSYFPLEQTPVPVSYASAYSYAAPYEPTSYATALAPTYAPQEVVPQPEISTYRTLERIQTAKELEEERLIREPSQELVGMGLYDEPGAEPILSGLTTGKTLKLEESWAPPETLISDDGEEDNEEDEVSPIEVAKPTVDVAAHAPQLPSINLSNQSFLFETDDDVVTTNDWWMHQQSKQLVVPTPAAGYGYSYSWYGS